MAGLQGEQQCQYRKDAEIHAGFLCDQVFKPAFINFFVISELILI